jgi:hypothetical protein
MLGGAIARHWLRKRVLRPLRSRATARVTSCAEGKRSQPAQGEPGRLSERFRRPLKARIFSPRRPPSARVRCHESSSSKLKWYIAQALSLLIRPPLRPPKLIASEYRSARVWVSALAAHSRCVSLTAAFYWYLDAYPGEHGLGLSSPFQFLYAWL